MYFSDLNTCIAYVWKLFIFFLDFVKHIVISTIMLIYVILNYSFLSFGSFFLMPTVIQHLQLACSFLPSSLDCPLTV